MKVIDLLNKIANGEEAIKKIKVGETLYTYHSHFDYYTENDNSLFGDRVCINKYDLNDEIEIIEEPKKIEKMEEYQMLYPEGALREDEAGLQIETLVKKVNELIDYINDKENK